MGLNLKCLVNLLIPLVGKMFQKINLELLRVPQLNVGFFGSSDHTTIHCEVYPSLEARVSLADQKGWCTKCVSGKHLLDKRPGKSASLPFKCYKCKKYEHHAAVCPSSKNFASKSSKSSFNYQSNPGVMNPVLSFTVSRGKSKSNFVFLLDTGAQFSSICKEAVEKYIDECRSPPMARLVCSYDQVIMGRRTKGYNYTAKLTLPCGQKIDVDFFAVENLSFQLTFPMLNNIVDNIHADSIPLHSDYRFQGGETVEVLGILGIDVLQHIKPYSHEELWVHGKRANFIKLPSGYIPFGSAELFLSSGKSKILRQRLIEKCVPWEDESSSNVVVKSKRKKKAKRTAVSDAATNEDVNIKNVKENLSDVKRQNLEFKPPKRVVGLYKYMVNCALEPSASKFDPLKEVFPCADVEYGLDNFCDLESIGIKDEFSYYELELIQNFNDSISFQDDHYYVHLPWNENLVKQAPSNLRVSLAVAERVYKNLEKQNIANAYEEVFKQQETLGIIEPVNQQIPDQIWIPHRPVIRNEANVTTKIRPVFNCSLKMGKAPSLNEAAFPGVDLMNNLLSLLLYFRSNFYVLLSDIAKAFLQIRLASEEDKNRFCFFRKINGKFVPYRYRTIIFGFVSSPFILNYVIQYHVSAHSSGLTSSLIRDKFYVDNLILTCNNDIMLSQYVYL